MKRLIMIGLACLFISRAYGIPSFELSYLNNTNRNIILHIKLNPPSLDIIILKSYESFKKTYYFEKIEDITVIIPTQSGKFEKYKSKTINLRPSRIESDLLVIRESKNKFTWELRSHGSIKSSGELTKQQEIIGGHRKH